MLVKNTSITIAAVAQTVRNDRPSFLGIFIDFSMLATFALSFLFAL
ncbi:hypothetical protein PIB19_01050 [Sphingomonas sp. 7/4-4]|nr:hypothetical protein [Sphingomonas sp. 7/4-4]WBY08176.1 hypothetical protein PIB19_01050 [Sphingomonas sp. 7/4-4]